MQLKPLLKQYLLLANKEYISQRFDKEGALSLFYKILMEEVRKMVIEVVRRNRRNGGR